MVLRNSSLGIALAALAVIGLPPETIDYAAIFSNNERAAVFVAADGHLYNGTTERMTGSGFFVSEDGLVLTNNHVTFAEKDNYKDIVVTVHVQSRTSPPLRAEIEWTDPVNDLALLRVSQAAARRVVLGTSAPMPVGSRIAVMGFPLTSDLSIVDGLISGKPGANRWQTNALLNFGNSGGPVFNAAGEVVGVVASGTVSATIGGTTAVDVDGINYFIPIDVLSRSVAADPARVVQGTPERPAETGKVRRLARAYTLSQVKDDHPLILASHSKTYTREFAAEPGYRIVSARVEELSANFVTNLSTTVAPAGNLVTVAFTLRSGPAIDRYRAWLHATVHTEQIRN